METFIAISDKPNNIRSGKINRSTSRIKLSLVALNENDTTEVIKNPDYVSPENWDYWPV